MPRLRAGLFLAEMAGFVLQDSHESAAPIRRFPRHVRLLLSLASLLPIPEI